MGFVAYQFQHNFKRLHSVENKLFNLEPIFTIFRALEQISVLFLAAMQILV